MARAAEEAVHEAFPDARASLTPRGVSPQFRVVARKERFLMNERVRPPGPTYFADLLLSFTGMPALV